MSATDGVALVWYQGALARRAARSWAGWPCWVYQTMARLWQTSPNGTVRSTARRTRLRAWPTPASWRASRKQTSMVRPRRGRTRRGDRGARREAVRGDRRRPQRRHGPGPHGPQHARDAEARRGADCGRSGLRTAAGHHRPTAGLERAGRRLAARDGGPRRRRRALRRLQADRQAAALVAPLGSADPDQRRRHDLRPALGLRLRADVPVSAQPT